MMKVYLQINEVLKLAGVQINESEEDNITNIIQEIMDNEYSDDEEEARKKVMFEKDILDKLPNTFKVYRAIKSDYKPNVFINNMKDELGIYWTNDISYAIPYDGYGRYTYIFETTIQKDMMDYDETLYTRSLYPEEEITLISGTTIKLENIYFEGKKMDISPIKDEIFEV